jgi:hypothetical protein
MFRRIAAPFDNYTHPHRAAPPGRALIHPSDATRHNEGKRTMKRYNLKATFKCGKLDKLEHGDFGPVGDDKGLKVEDAAASDCFICWPVDPIFTGRRGIASMLGWETTRRFNFDDAPEWAIG